MQNLSINGRAIVLPFLFIILSYSCTSSPPPEIKPVEDIDRELYRIEADKYLPDGYLRFKHNIKGLKDKIIHEKSRFSLLRNYEEIYKITEGVIDEGNEVLRIIRIKRDEKRQMVFDKIKSLEVRVKIIDEITLKINAGIYARKKLTLGDLAIKEAKISLENGKYDSALERIEMAYTFLEDAEKPITPILRRYAHNDLIAKWKGFVNDTIKESGREKKTAIIVDKAEQTLTLYKNGKIIMTFNIGLGKNGYKDKLLSGDGATPEGRYHITKKAGEGESKYYKALLLNYPNQDDKREFLRAKQRGLISKTSKIGGLIEIHGGGNDGTTYGCIALENHDMDKLFEMVTVGTPVTIVGTINPNNEFYNSLKKLEAHLKT
jgi:lipoprotein-anchoring transpeptidase ErfK/SrfK